MSGSCCGGSVKSEPNKVAMTAAKTTEAAPQQTAAISEKNECCKDTPAKNEKHACGC